MRYTFKTTPYKHQAIALKKCISQPDTALLLDPGLGKTKISIDDISVRNMRDGLSRVLVLAPKVMLGVWEDEIETHMPDYIEREVYRISGKKKKKLDLITLATTNSRKEIKKLHIIIMTYDSLAPKRMKNSRKKNDDYKKAILKFEPEAIICDESQLIKSHSSSRSKAAHSVSKSAKHKMILTGTMITKNPLDVFGQYRFLNDKIFGTRWTDFRFTFARYGGYLGKQIIGWQNLNKLAEGVHQIAVRMRKEECLDLPEKTFVKVPVELEDKTRKIYNEMKEQMITELEGETFTAEIAMVKALRLQQIAGGFITRREGSEKFTQPVGEYEKVKATVELAQLRIEEGSKVVIYGKYIWELHQIMDRLKKAKLKPMMIYGGTSEKNIDDYMDKFQNSDDYPVMVMQVSKGLGITLHAANVAIFHSLSHRYDNFQQCQDRIHRIGQKKPVTYYIMLAKNSIDYHIYRSVMNKWDFSKYIQDRQYNIFDD